MTDVPDLPIPMADASAQWAAAPAPAPVVPDASVAPDQPPVPEGQTAPDAPAEPEVPAGQPRDAQGRFAAPDGTAPAEPAPETPPVPTIEARLGDEVVALRADTLIPIKRGGQVEYRTLEQVQREGMLKADYDAKMRERAEERRTWTQTEARLKAREEALASREAELKGALTDPAKYEAYQEHLRQLEANPAYRQMVDRALEADTLKAEMAARQAAELESRTADAIDTVTRWVDDAVARYPGVDPDRVRTLYGQALAGGFARLDPADVEQIVAKEAQALEATTSPLRQQLAALEAKLARMEADAAAAKTNATTAHALQRGATIPTAPAGRPPAPGPRVLETPGGRRDHGSLKEAWVKTA